MENLSPKQLLLVEKYSERLASSINFITDAEKDGYYLEAVVRIDALIDLALTYMLYFSCETDERFEELKLISGIIGDEKFIRYAPRILVKKNLINDALRIRLDAWKDFRNTVVHNLFGTWEFLGKRYKFDIKNLEDKEKILLKEECKKGRALLRDIIKEFVNKKSKGEANFTELHLGEGT
jgi:hypothetical protein